MSGAIRTASPAKAQCRERERERDIPFFIIHLYMLYIYIYIILYILIPSADLKQLCVIRCRVPSASQTSQCQSYEYRSASPKQMSQLEVVVSHVSKLALIYVNQKVVRK